MDANKLGNIRRGITSAELEEVKETTKESKIQKT